VLTDACTAVRVPELECSLPLKSVIAQVVDWCESTQQAVHICRSHMMSDDETRLPRFPGVVKAAARSMVSFAGVRAL